MFSPLVVPPHAHPPFTPGHSFWALFGVGCRYNQVFSGEEREVPLPLVDFVPVGYDLDLLEVRLLELYDFVSLFVLFEAPFTHKVGRRGWASP